MNDALIQPASGEFSIMREFDAPRELVWKAFTEPRHFEQWWGPAGMPVHVAKLDLQPGGTFVYGMQAPGHPTTWLRWVFREIVKPAKLVMFVAFCDETGTQALRHPMMPAAPLEKLSTLTFSEENGQTVMTNRAVPWNATEEEHDAFAASREGMFHGFTKTFDQLSEYLAKMPQIR